MSFIVSLVGAIILLPLCLRILVELGVLEHGRLQGVPIRGALNRYAHVHRHDESRDQEAIGLRMIDGEHAAIDQLSATVS